MVGRRGAPSSLLSRRLVDISNRNLFAAFRSLGVSNSDTNPNPNPRYRTLTLFRNAGYETSGIRTAWLAYATSSTPSDYFPES